MARLPRLAAAGYPHHLIQRGNNRMVIFRAAEDRQHYLAWLHELARDLQVAVHAYVLMPNHVHLLATPTAADALSRMMQALGRRYVRWFNDRNGRSGTLWEGRFRSAVIDSDRYLLTCSRYIELNPVRAGLVADPADYPWSSYRHHVGAQIDPLITDHAVFWSLGNTPFERQSAYRGLFESPIATSDLEAIRHRTNRGWAVGTAEFLSALGTHAKRGVSPRLRGRPKRAVGSGGD
jgi:putative transposase